MSHDPDDHQLTIRPLLPADTAAIAPLIERLMPERIVGRDAERFLTYFARLRDDPLTLGANVTVVVACDAEDWPIGILAVRPDTEYFTGAPRVYLETLAVATEVEGRGVARMLMR